MKKFLILTVFILGCSGANQNTKVNPTVYTDFKSQTYVAVYTEYSGNCGSIPDQFVDFNNYQVDTKACRVIANIDNKLIEMRCEAVINNCKLNAVMLTYSSFNNKPGNSVMELDVECKDRSCASIYFIRYEKYR